VVLTERMIDNNLKNDGDTCEFSQRTCLLNALKDFEQNISGINYDDVLDDEPSIERIGNVISVNGKPINESHNVEYRLIEREEIISDLINWISECHGNDCCLMKQDLEMLIGWSDTWILLSLLVDVPIIIRVILKFAKKIIKRKIKSILSDKKKSKF
jgi:hypothetical protein